VLRCRVACADRRCRPGDVRAATVRGGAGRSAERHWVHSHRAALLPRPERFVGENDMKMTSVSAQLRTTDLGKSIDFYTKTLGLELAFRYEDFYAGIRAGNQMFHLKMIDAKDPSIDDVRNGEHFHLYLTTDDIEGTAALVKRADVKLVRDIRATPWGTREIVIEDDQGHTLYVGEDSDG
jgi:catechol 2,3-dioxygenase-like lactoylglutathione lyase family enzyme